VFPVAQPQEVKLGDVIIIARQVDGVCRRALEVWLLGNDGFVFRLVGGVPPPFGGALVKLPFFQGSRGVLRRRPAIGRRLNLPGFLFAFLCLAVRRKGDPGHRRLVQWPVRDAFHAPAAAGRREGAVLGCYITIYNEEPTELNEPTK